MATEVATAEEGRPSPLAVHAALVAIQIAFSSLAVVGKIAFRHLPPDAVVFARTASGAVAFLAIFAIRRSPLRVPARELPTLAMLSLLGVILNQILFLRGLSRTTAINATVLGATIPVFTILVGLALRHERWRPALAIGIPLSLGGVLYLVGTEALHVGPDTVAGDVMIIVNALSYASYLVLARGAIARLGAARVMAWAFVIGTIATAPFGAASLVRAVPALPREGWLALAWIAAVPTVFAYLANAWALRWARSTTVAVYIYLQPVATAIMAVTILDERPSPRLALAAVLILGGIGVVIRSARSAA